jgi:N-acylneuraminate cytidylyltransferase
LIRRSFEPVSTPSLTAFIPARAGSQRVPGKNVRRLGAHPLLAYAIAAARESGIFQSVIVSTDSPEYAEIARHYGAEVPFLRPAAMAGALSPDIEWVEYTLRRLREAGRDCDAFSILRPTSPFRQAATIRRAWQEFQSQIGVDSLRAVEKCREHPGKMWVVRGARMTPLLPLGPPSQPWHSTAYQALPEIYIQNASLEIAWSRVVFETRTIAGHVVMPFFMPEHEGFDVNNPIDWQAAEKLVQSGEALLPPVPQAPYSKGKS